MQKEGQQMMGLLYTHLPSVRGMETLWLFVFFIIIG